MPRKEKFADLIGKKMGSLTVVAGPENRVTAPTSTHPNGRNLVHWETECSDCGERTWRLNYTLSSGSARCSCRRIQNGLAKKSERAAENLIGKQFGDFVVLDVKMGNERLHPRRQALVRCVCGEEMWKYVVYLKRGEVTNCGCRKGAKQVERAERLRKNATRAEEVPAMISNYRRSAQKRGYDFNLSLEDVIRLTAGDCEYCGAPPSRPAPNRRQESGLRYNGIDRIDNAIGYTVENCVPCCSECNVSKSASTVESFTNWVKRAYTHLAEKENPLPAPSLSPLQWAVQ